METTVKANIAGFRFSSFCMHLESLNEQLLVHPISIPMVTTIKVVINVVAIDVQMVIISSRLELPSIVEISMVSSQACA
jgi:hypothetical protein